MTDNAQPGAADGCPDQPRLSPQQRWDRANPKAKWAHQALASALARGIITRGPCEVCGARHGTDGAVIHGHHDDYERPMAVRWLCMAHHRKLHATPEDQRANLFNPDHQTKKDH